MSKILYPGLAYTCAGAMVLGHSLRDNGTTKQLAVLVTLDTLSASTLDELKKVYDHLIPVDHIVNKTPANLHVMNRLDLVSTFTKIALWRQTMFRKIVYVDADMVALRAPDELFQQNSSFAAVPDIGWPDCFNSGLLVLSPNIGDYYGLLTLAERGISFDGADQGLLNTHFPNWQRLSFTYNCTPSGNYQYVPAYRHFQSSINMVHFIGAEKPWNVGKEWKGAGGVHEELLGRWWAVYDKHYRNTAVVQAPGQSQAGPRIVQQYVKGESTPAESQYTSFATTTKTQLKGSASLFRENTQPAREVTGGDIKPFSTSQGQDIFTAWDASREPPPINTTGEAASLVIHNITSSSDRSLFQPPASYPAPPTSLGYDIPPTSPINSGLDYHFPWEATQKKAIRVFPAGPVPSSSKTLSTLASADPVPKSSNKLSTSASANPVPDSSNILSTLTFRQDSGNESASPASPASPIIPEVQTPSRDPWGKISYVNAWDQDPVIERVIRRHPLYQHSRRVEARYERTSRPGSPRALCAICSKSAECSNCGSPLQGASPPDPDSQQRRPSLRITDFPSALERPSLPVTPAPIRRGTLWGSEVGKSSQLPAADDVPNQADWDPWGKLAELQKKQAEMLEAGPSSPKFEIPDRLLPGSSAALPKV
ncbi:MAG: hypothetical protein Q9220_001988 [cf. Caloplaca sp. 1 TL-2023]